MLSINILEVNQGSSDITWLLWLALGFFLVVVFVGWFSSRKEGSQTNETKHEDH